MTTTEKQPTRFLGEGSVGKIYKRYMFVDDIRFGRVYIPLDASWPKAPDCTDLRNIFSTNDSVVFTAIRQTQKQHECNYVACSVIHKNDLQIVSGKISEKCNQYAYCDSPKLGKVFVPFSARSDGGRPWHGRNADIGTVIGMKVLPQPEFQKCSHVAFAVVPLTASSAVVKEDLSSTGSTRTDRQPENITNQFGVIVVEPTDDSDGLIYAQTTGSISFTKNTLNGKGDAGTFVYFDAMKSLAGQQHEKCSWKASAVYIIGHLNCVECDMSPNRFSTTLDNCLTVTVTAIVCRVSHSNSSAWLWNDLLGRIFVNNHHYVDDLHAFDVVTVKAQFTAAFEDVPWSAISVRIVHDDEKALREEYGQLMVTSDKWKVLYVCQQPTGGFFGFMENPAKEAAFMAWTDLNVGETPPEKDALCRVTAYKQHRDKRHPWRALLVTELDEKTFEPLHSHPMFNTSGTFAPTVASQIRLQKPPQRQISQPAATTTTTSNGITILPTTNTNVWTVPSATISNSKIVTQHQTSSSNTSIDSGRASAGFSVVNETPINTPIDPPPGFGSIVNLPIGAERALNLQNGDTPRTPSVDLSVIPGLSDCKNNDILHSLLSSENNTNNNYNSYTFNPWQGLGLDRSTTWQPLGSTTPLIDNNKCLSNGFGNNLIGNGSNIRYSSMTSPTFNDALLTTPIINNSSSTQQQQRRSTATPSSTNLPSHHNSISTTPSANILDDDINSYEKFLCDEMLKRPHLLPKLLKKLAIANNMDTQRILSEISNFSTQQYGSATI